MDAVISLEALCLWSAMEVGSVKPNSPSFVGRPNSACSSREHGGLPVMVGMSFCCIASSTGCRRWPQLATVLHT